MTIILEILIVLLLKNNKKDEKKFEIFLIKYLIIFIKKNC